MTDNNKILLKTDLAMKLVFGRDDSRCKFILKSLLQTILNIEIDTLEYKNPINLNDTIDSKQTEFAISIEISGNVNCDIEIQLRNHAAFKDRLVFYGATLLTKNLEGKKGENSKQSYAAIKRAIVICLADFEMFEELESYQSNFVMKDREMNHYLSDVIEVITLEMPKVESKKPVNEMTEMEKWLTYIRHNGNERYEEKIAEIVRESEAIEMAETVFNEIKNDEQARSALLSRQRFQFDINAKINDCYDKGVEVGEEKGEKKGIEKGLKQGKIETIMNFYKTGASIEMISRATGMTEAEILELVKRSE